MTRAPVEPASLRADPIMGILDLPESILSARILGIAIWMR
jgi:hypothetical protein